MTKDEFCTELLALGFEASGDDFCRSHAASPFLWVRLSGEGAYSHYDYGGDTGPVELTTPSVAPYEEVLEEIKPWL
jgi:hypothetical protein